MALVDEESGTITIGHVGDSRAYRIRDGQLEQLTDDHSLVAELVRSGRLTQEEADQHPHRSVITRALGTEEAVEVDTLTAAMEAGDLYLICSDGLTIMLGRRADPRRWSVRRTAISTPPRRRSSAAANDAGGEDNVTVVLVAIEEGAPAMPRRPIEPRGAAASHRTRRRRSAPLAPSSPPSPVRRWGAGAGRRLPALLMIVASLAIAALVLSGASCDDDPHAGSSSTCCSPSIVASTAFAQRLDRRLGDRLRRVGRLGARPRGPVPRSPTWSCAGPLRSPTRRCCP